MKPLPPEPSRPRLLRAAVAERKASKRGGSKSGGKKGASKKSQNSSRSKKSAESSSGRTPRPSVQGETLFTRKNGFLALAATAIGLWLIFFYPFSTDFTRRATLGLGMMVVALLLGLFWRVKLARWGIVLTLMGIGTFVALPGRTNYDRLALRAEFARVLRRYEGTRYCKGGEGTYGIDGQGLVRRASIEAPFLYGVRTVNPWLIRHAFSAWWERELPLGKWPLNRRITKIKAVHGFNDLILYPGDYALLEQGAGEAPEAILYLGHHEWIVADKERATIRMVDGRKAGANPSLQQAGALFRWRLLEARR